MSTLPRPTPARTALVQHYALLDEVSGIATLVSGIGYQFRAEADGRSTLVRMNDSRLTLLGHVHMADRQWQQDLDVRKVWEQAHV